MHSVDRIGIYGHMYCTSLYLSFDKHKQTNKQTNN